MSEAQFNFRPDADVRGALQTAMEGMPAIDVNIIIRLIAEVTGGEKTPEAAAKEFARPYQAFAEVFARDKANELLAAGIGAVGIESLANRSFSEQLIKSAEKVAVYVREYMNGEITEDQFISRIGGSGIKDINMQILSALGIHEKMGVENAAEITKLAPAVLAFTASMAAYKELRKAMDDLAVAKERRLQIEVACQESISMIRQYRAEMERIVSNYLAERLDTFESGFEAMDRAIVDGDIDGYIKGNTEIQSILGYDVQFTSQDEFDALMDSDDAFKL